MIHPRRRSRRTSVLVAATLGGMLAGVDARPTAADVSTASGSACGYYTNVGLFGGPPAVRGCGQVESSPPTTGQNESRSPSVTLPAGGSATPVSANDPNGARAMYGPAAIFAGIWPESASSAPPSGPITVSTRGTTGPSGSVTSSTGIVLNSPPNANSPGGIGPGPLVAEEAHSTCTANESGVTGSATFVNGILETKYDTETQLPTVTEPIPVNPPPNYTRSGTIDHVGDRYTIVLNEQVIGPDSITVNAAHMYLLGDVARGDMVVGSSTCSLTSTVPNGAPTATDDGYSTAEDVPLTVSGAGLLGNDTDPDGNPLRATTARAVPDAATVYTFPSDPANGTVALNPDGTFTYTPDADFAGTDTFTYVARDARGATDSGTVTITVTPNQLPVAADDSYSTPAGAPVNTPAPGLLGNDTDPEGGPITAGSASDPAGGTVTLNADGSFAYVPDPLFTGTDTFTYVVSDDDGNSDTGLVTITVVPPNSPPVAGDDSFGTNQNTQLAVAAPGVLANDTDPNGNSLSAGSASDPANGSVTLNANGAFTYSPDTGFVGTDSFTYTVSDGLGGTDTGLVSINVAAVNSPPVAGDDSYATTQNTPLTIAAPGVLGNDTDPDGNPLTAGAGSDPAGGSVTLNADGSFTYTPDTGFVGTDTFTYTVSDGVGGTDSGLVSINVAAVNGPPVAGDDSYGASQNTQLTVAAPGVLGNDTDPNGNPLSAGSATDPAGGSVTLVADGSFTYTPDTGFGGTDTFTYTVSDGLGATDSGLVTIAVSAPAGPSVAGSACGYTATVGIFGGPADIRGCGQSPSAAVTAASPSVTLPPTGSATPITANDPDGARAVFGPATIFGGIWPPHLSSAPPSGPLTVSTQGTPGSAASVTSSAGIVLHSPPNPNAPGGIGPGPVVADEAHSTCTASESGVSGSARFVNGILETKYDTSTQLPIVTEPIPANPPPNYTRSGVLDHIGDRWTVVINEQVIGPDSITVNAAHLYLLGPTARGDVVIASSTCSLSSMAPNGAPAANDDAVTTSEDTPITVAGPGLLANDADPDGHALTATNSQAAFVPGPNHPSSSGGNTFTFPSDPAHGTVAVNPDGSFSYTPDTNYSGTDSFTYVARDPRGANDTGLVTVNVTSVADAPVAGDDTDVAVEDVPLTRAAPGVLANDTDGDGNTLSAGAASDPANGSVTLNADGAYVYVPDANFVGTDTFTYTVSDGTGLTDTGLVTIVVSPDAASILKDIAPGPNNSAPASFTQVGSTLFFSAYSTEGQELWKTDGTAAGTVMVKDISAGAGSSFPANFTDGGGVLYFTAMSAGVGSSGTELWKSDGTAAGTVMVKDINPGTASSSPTNLKAVGGTLFFSANNGILGAELWKSDGTDSGTVLVKDINVGTGGSSPSELTQAGSAVFFSASGGTTGTELWRTDGTDAGTVMVKDIIAGTGSSLPSQMRTIGTTVYFAASDGTVAGSHGTELWKTDGTAAGTVLVKDIRSGTGSAFPSSLTVFGTTLLFSASDALDGAELWRSDGTEAGTVKVKSIYPDWVSSSPSGLTVVGGMVLFAASNDAGRELWRTDGTAAGTILVRDIKPGPDSSFVSSLAVVGDVAYFSADDGVKGEELWRSDGSTDGTAIAEDINVGAGSSQPSSLTPALGTMFFKANDGMTGQEPWRLVPAKQAPVAGDDAYATAEDSPLTVAAPGVLGNDTDANGQTLSAGSASDPANGSVTVNADGSFTYAPDANFAGTDTFTYVVNDGDGGTDSGLVTITVTPANDGPLAVDDTYTAERGLQLTVAAPGVLTNDTDADGGTLSAGSASDPPGGTVVLNANGSFSYTPDSGFGGTDTFTYVVSDGQGGSDTGLVTITVRNTTLLKDIVPGAGGSSPTRFAQIGNTSYFLSFTNQPTNGLWKTDGTPVGTTLVKNILQPGFCCSQPAPTVVGGIMYFQADNGTGGTELWRSDGTTSGTVLLKDIRPGGSSSPTDFKAVGNTLYFLANDGTTGKELWKSDGTAAGTVRVKDINPGTASSFATNLTQVGSSLFFQAFDAATGSELWKSDGTAAGTVRVKDISTGLNSSSPGPIVAMGTTAYFAAYDATAGKELWRSDGTEAGTVRVKDIYPLAGSGGPNHLVVVGSTLYFDGTDTVTGTELWKSDGTELGTVLVKDAAAGGGSSYPGGITAFGDGVLYTAMVANNDRELWRSNGTDLGTALVKDINVGAAGSWPTDITVVGSAAYFAADNGISGVELWRTEGGGRSTVLVEDVNPGTASSSPSNLTSARGTLFFSATDGATGVEPWRVTSTLPNNAPVAVDDAYSTTEDTSLNVAAPGVLGNDTDPNANPLTAGSASDPAHGSVTLAYDGSFTYTPDVHFFGTDTFTYEVADGRGGSDTGLVTVTVLSANDLPMAEDDAYATDEDSSLTVAAPGVLSNDSDADDPLTAVLVTGPANGSVTLNGDGAFTYVPNPSFAGTDSFTYNASDGHRNGYDNATVTITVAAINDAPVAGDDAYSTSEDTPLLVAAPGVLGNDTDADGGTRTAGAASDPAGGGVALNSDGSFTYTPDANFFGTDSFTYVVSDGQGGTDTGLVTISVAQVNDAPVAGDDSYGTSEDTPLTVAAPGVLANDSDADGDPLQAGLHSGPTSGAVTVNANGSFTYTPNANFAGTDTITYYTTDGRGGFDFGTLTVVVAAVNDAPVAGDDAYAASEDSPLTVPAAGVLTNDTDVDGGTLSAGSASDPVNGTVSLGADGSFTYTPDANFAGSDSFTYVVSDGRGGTDTGLVTISVAQINDAPVAGDDSYGTSEDTPLTVVTPGVLGNDSDADGDPLQAGLHSGPTSGAVTVNANGSFTYTPNANFAGTDTITYYTTDGRGGFDFGTVTVAVAAVNDAPVAGDDAYVASEDSPLTVPAAGVLANDTDVDGATLAAGSATDPANGTVSLGADGSFTYAPDANFAGTDTFTYAVSDVQGGSDTGLVTITVAAVNDAPAAGDDAYSTSEDTLLTVPAPGVLTNDTDIDGGAISADSASDPTNGTVTLVADGSFSYTPDDGFAGTDTFTYTVSDGQGGTDGATVTVTVAAAPDVGPTSLSVADISVIEGNTGRATATFTVTRTGNVSNPSSVKYRTTGGNATAGTDYTSVPLTTMTFGGGETSKTVVVNVTADTLPEANETFNLVLSAPSGAVISDASGTASILNDDGAAYLSVNDVTVTEGHSGTTGATFTVTRSGNTTGASSLKYKTTTGTAGAADFTAVGLTVLDFAVGETTRTVTVDIAGDTTDEINERFTLNLSAPVGATISDTAGAGTIVDDDGPIVTGPATFLSVGDVFVNEGNSGTAAAAFTVTRSGSADAAATVKYRTSGGTATAGSDYTAAPLTTLSFAAGETTKTVTVDVKGDPLPEANETLNVVLSAATGAVISDASGTATVVNDDGSAYLAVNDVSVTEGDSGTTRATFTITRTGNTTGQSSVKVKTITGTAGTADFTAVSLAVVSFAADETTKTVTVEVTGDTTDEVDEKFTLALSAPVGGTISDAAGTAVIMDDD